MQMHIAFAYGWSLSFLFHQNHRIIYKDSDYTIHPLSTDGAFGILVLIMGAELKCKKMLFGVIRKQCMHSQVS